MKERRKIINMGGGEYQLLKPRTNDYNSCWHNYGERKSLKAISDLVDSGRFELDISEEIMEEIKYYRKKIAERKEIYFKKNGLENNLKN